MLRIESRISKGFFFCFLKEEDFVQGVACNPSNLFFGTSRLQTMSRADSPSIAITIGRSRCNINVTHVCCSMTPADRPPYVPVPRIRRPLDLSSCPKHNVKAVVSGALPPQPQHPRIKPPATVPCLPADDGRFERGTSLTRHMGGGAQFRGAVDCCCCGLSTN